MNGRRLAAHGIANLLHAAASIGAAAVTYQTVTIRHVPAVISALAVFALTVTALDPLAGWLIAKLTAPTGPATTGPEFAARHGNDSSDWTPADFETVQNLAAMDAQPAWTALRQKPAPQTTTNLAA